MNPDPGGPKTWILRIRIRNTAVEKMNLWGWPRLCQKWMGELPSERGKMPLRFRPDDDDFGASPVEVPPACTSKASIPANSCLLINFAGKSASIIKYLYMANYYFI
jgi:hypothetical protein